MNAAKKRRLYEVTREREPMNETMQAADDHDDAVRAAHYRETAERRYQEEQIELWKAQFGDPNDPAVRRQILRTSRELLRRNGLSPANRPGPSDPFRMGTQASPADVHGEPREPATAPKPPALGYPVSLDTCVGEVASSPADHPDVVFFFSHPSVSRRLACGHCNMTYSLSVVQENMDIFGYHWNDRGFLMRCPNCKHSGVAEIADRCRSGSLVTIEIAGDQVWLIRRPDGGINSIWDLPEQLREAIRAGNSTILRSCPREIIETFLAKGVLKFAPGVLHRRLVADQSVAQEAVPAQPPDQEYGLARVAELVNAHDLRAPLWGVSPLAAIYKWAIASLFDPVLQALPGSTPLHPWAPPRWDLFAHQRFVRALDMVIQGARYQLATMAAQRGGLTPELAPLVQSRSDDVAAQMRGLQLILGHQIRTTDLKSIGLDYRNEMRQMLEDQKFEAEERAKLAREMERVE